MSTLITPPAKPTLVYPESDGLPIADNTKQFEWTVTIEGGLEAMYADDPDVFVAGDLFWYPLEQNTKLAVAPDVMVVFGRPKGHRGSYLQWLEDNIAPQVTFEIWSPSNRPRKSIEKFQFFERYGVEEYYIYDPEDGSLDGWLRINGKFEIIQEMQGWVSPRLKVTFALDGCDLVITRPDGQRFLSYVELAKQKERERLEKEKAKQRADILAAQLRALGVEPEA